jgi:anti-sigma factor RsiW
MRTSRCDWIDGFLGQWLSQAERAEFVNHLAGCPRCRQTVHEQERINSLVRRAVETLQPVPIDLTDSIHRRLQPGRHRRLGWMAALTAAAVMAGLASWWLLRPRQADLRPLPRVAPAPPFFSQQPPESKNVVEVTFARPADVIAVPRQSDNRAVTIVWVYPAVRAEPPKPIPLNSH